MREEGLVDEAALRLLGGERAGGRQVRLLGEDHEVLRGGPPRGRFQDPRGDLAGRGSLGRRRRR
ncbi:MAG: hypothetical protein DYH06_22285, partial [Acidobacteria bacterium ACB2]|nr:hypothetical protein [Acidobacteria bacterium ACB2]